MERNDAGNKANWQVQIPGSNAPSADGPRPQRSAKAGNLRTFLGNVRHPARPETVRGPTEQIDCFTGDAAVQCSSMMAKRHSLPRRSRWQSHPRRAIRRRRRKGGLRNVGDPVELALRYNEQGADEMVFFDITATAHGRGTMVDVIERAADQCFMPLTVGGGIKSVDDMY